MFSIYILTLSVYSIPTNSDDLCKEFLFSAYTHIESKEVTIPSKIIASGKSWILKRKHPPLGRAGDMEG